MQFEKVGWQVTPFIPKMFVVAAQHAGAKVYPDNWQELFLGWQHESLPWEHVTNVHVEQCLLQS